MDAVNIATIVVALIAAAGAWASQRAAAKAAVQNTVVGGRVNMENEAYERARAFDTETIARQNHEIEELRKDSAELRKQHEACATEIYDMKARHEVEITMLRNRISRLERDTFNHVEEVLRERLKDRPHNERETDGDTAV